MKLIPETFEDFGIFYTGSELKEFNKKFKGYFSRSDNNMTTKAKVLLCSVGTAVFAANVFIPCRYARDVLTVLLMLMMPVVLAGFFIWGCFMEDRVCGTRVRNCTLAVQILLIFPIGITALTGFKLLDYLIYLFCLIVGIPIGMNGWSRRMIKELAVSDGAAAGKKENHGGSIAAIAGAAVVPVIRAFSAAAGKRGMYIFLGLCTSFLCILFGWIGGLGMENIRYYRFLSRKKGKRTNEE